MTRLKDAGIREIEFARENLLPLLPGVTFDALLDHGVYDPRLDTVAITIKAVTYTRKVTRP